MTKILICGSRLERKGARAVVENILARYNPKTDTVIQGGAPGVDAVAAAVAQARGFHVVTVPADWTRYGASAGPKRNAAMVSMAPDVVFCLPYPCLKQSRGTLDTYKRAVHARLKVIVVPLPPDDQRTLALTESKKDSV